MTEEPVPAWVPKTLRNRGVKGSRSFFEIRRRTVLANRLASMAVGHVDRRAYFAGACQLWTLPLRERHMGDGVLVLVFEAEAGGSVAGVSDFRWAAVVRGELSPPDTAGSDEFKELESHVRRTGYRLATNGDGEFAQLIWQRCGPQPAV